MQQNNKFIANNIKSHISYLRNLKKLVKKKLNHYLALE